MQVRLGKAEKGVHFQPPSGAGSTDLVNRIPRANVFLVRDGAKRRSIDITLTVGL